MTDPTIKNFKADNVSINSSLDLNGSPPLYKAVNGYFVINISESLTTNNPFIINTFSTDRFDANGNPYLDILPSGTATGRLYSTRINSSRGKVIKLILKSATNWNAASGGLSGIMEAISTADIVSKCYISPNSSYNYSNFMNTITPVSVTNNIENDTTLKTSYGNSTFLFNGADYSAGSIMTIGFNFDIDWSVIAKAINDKQGLTANTVHTIYFFYELITADFIN